MMCVFVSTLFSQTPLHISLLLPYATPPLFSNVACLSCRSSFHVLMYMVMYMSHAYTAWHVYVNVNHHPQQATSVAITLCLQHGAFKMGCSTAGGTSSQTLSHPNHEHSSAVLPSQQPDPNSAAASAIGNPSPAVDEPSPPSTISESTALGLDTGTAGHSSVNKNSSGSQAAAADADATTACTAADVLGIHAAASHHEDCPNWLPEQLAQLQQQYSDSAARSRAGLSGDALLGQRVAFALLEDFHQHDSRREVDTLLAGLHTGQ